MEGVRTVKNSCTWPVAYTGPVFVTTNMLHSFPSHSSLEPDLTNNPSTGLAHSSRKPPDGGLNVPVRGGGIEGVLFG